MWARAVSLGPSLAAARVDAIARRGGWLEDGVGGRGEGMGVLQGLLVVLCIAAASCSEERLDAVQADASQRLGMSIWTRI